MNDDEFDNTPPQATRTDRTMDTIPDGRYMATVQDVSFFVANSGAKCESWWFAIARGPYKGKCVQLFTFDINGRNAGRVKARVLMVARGQRANVRWSDLYSPEHRTVQPWVREECVGAVVEIAQRTTKGTSKTFVDVYVNGLVAEAPASVPASSPRQAIAEAIAEAPPNPPAPSDDTWGADATVWDEDADNIPF